MNGIAGYLFIGVLLASSPAVAELFKYGEPGCDKCKQGEYLQRVKDTVPAGGNYVTIDDPPCAGDQDGTNKSAKAVKDTKDPRIEAGVGALAIAAQKLNIGGTIGGILTEMSDRNKARCSLVCGALPSGAEVTGVALYMKAYNADVMHKCEPGTKCVAQYARAFPPKTADNLVCIMISNWSHNLERPVVFEYWFKSPTKTPIEYR